ncbi:hypothetical protein [Rhizobium alvei]|uniref:Ribbon-helix-helix protein CopG domain-containing protein n=1 Tax=Rhizobium alvei TaxID=1132659 RepID=A0ABT8YT87_9HYPH|nr:hypothetical protein [Rhizobium alvei]MDO6966933.1 hypothetical protein [Rhizobium alvei]
MTQAKDSALSRRMGRKKQFQSRITLPLTDEMIKRIDQVRGEDEDRVTMIRSAIDAELERREKADKK